MPGVTAIKLIKQVQKTHDIGTAVIVSSVDTVVEGNEPASNGREQVVCVLTELNIVSAKPREVFDEYYVDTLGLGVLNQTLDTGTLEVCSRETVINIHINLIPAPVMDILLKKKFLIFDADGLAIPFVIVAQATIDANIVCSFSHLFILPACQFSYICGDWLSPDFSDAAIMQEIRASCKDAASRRSENASGLAQRPAPT